MIDETLPSDKIDEMLPKAIFETKVTPVMCGCAKKGIGVSELLDFITKYMPHADYKKTEETSGIIFKIDHDKTMGKIAHVRMFGGKIQNRAR